MSIFGTDGVRCRSNVFPMTVAHVLKMGQALALQLKKKSQNKPRVIIGKDTRLSGYMYETALASGLISYGVDVLFLGPVPTAAVSMLIDEFKASAGIMITASHNLYEDNGLKFFNHLAYKFSEKEESDLESNLENISDDQYVDVDQIGKATRIDDAIGRYLTHIKKVCVNYKQLNGLNLIMDCANGSAYKAAPQMFFEMGADCHVINDRPNGSNINLNCGALDTKSMRSLLLEKKADMGIAFDGDADRLIVCDEKGQILDGDDILYLILNDHLQKSDVSVKGIVGTVMSNMALEQFCIERNVEFYRSNVGDKQVVNCLKDNELILGGENSGHIVNLNHAKTGDGLLNAFTVANILQSSKKALSELLKDFKKMPQKTLSLKVEHKIPLEECKYLTAATKQAQMNLDKSGRVLIRYSGTENKIRLMVECEDEKMLENALNQLASAAKKDLNIMEENI